MDKKQKNIIIISITIILLILLAILLFFLNRPRTNSPDTVGNTASNLYNGGTFCQRGNKVFFANSNDNDSLYVMNLDESKPKKIVSNSVLSINADDNWVYYSLSGKSNGKGLGYVRKSAGMFGCNYSGTKDICYTQNPVATFVLIGNNLYYQNYIKSKGTSLYSVTINKDKIHQVSEDMINPSCVQNGHIIYSGVKDNHFLYEMDMTTEQSFSILEKDMYMPIYHDDGYVYYLNPTEKYTLHRVNPSSGEDILIADERIDFYNIWNGYIYYQVSYGSDPALYRINSDGTGLITLAQGVYKNLMTTDSYLYFRDFNDETVTYHVKHGDTNVEIFNPAK